MDYHQNNELLYFEEKRVNLKNRLEKNALV